MFITIIKESMEHIIKIDNETYICKLGEPFRVWKFFKTPINPIAGRFLGINGYIYIAILYNYITQTSHINFSYTP